MVKCFCPFCKTEVPQAELEYIDSTVADIDIREGQISVLLVDQHLLCAECHKDINLNQDGLLVQESDSAELKKMTVKVES